MQKQKYIQKDVWLLPRFKKHGRKNIVVDKGKAVLVKEPFIINPNNILSICLLCHTAFKPSDQKKYCQDCMKKVQNDIDKAIEAIDNIKQCCSCGKDFLADKGEEFCSIKCKADLTSFNRNGHWPSPVKAIASFCLRCRTPIGKLDHNKGKARTAVKYCPNLRCPLYSYRLTTKSVAEKKRQKARKALQSAKFKADGITPELWDTMVLYKEIKKLKRRLQDGNEYRN